MIHKNLILNLEKWLREEGSASRSLHTLETNSCIIQKRRQIQINRHEINTNRLNGAATVGGAGRHKYRPPHESNGYLRSYFGRDSFHRF